MIGKQNDGQFKDKERELAYRESQLRQREAELAKRESRMPQDYKPKNWPPCFPVAHHSIESDIPAESQSIVRKAYYLWICELRETIRKVGGDFGITPYLQRKLG